MDYEKLHKDTIAKLQDMVNSGKITVDIARGICADFVPESDGERIRKNLITFISTLKNPLFSERERKEFIAWLEKQGKKIVAIENFDTEFEKQVSHLIASSMNKEHEYSLEYVKWVSNALLNYAKHELERSGEQKPAELVNGEDYGIDSLWHAQRILEKTLGEVEGYQSDDGILEHKCAISAVKELSKQTPEWTEEDDKLLNDAMSLAYECDDLKLKDWLKSLKYRVQHQNCYNPYKRIKPITAV